MSILPSPFEPIALALNPSLNKLVDVPSSYDFHSDILEVVST